MYYYIFNIFFNYFMCRFFFITFFLESCLLEFTWKNFEIYTIEQGARPLTGAQENKKMVESFLLKNITSVILLVFNLQLYLLILQQH